MDYEIVATLGPASNTPDVWKSMLSSGVTGFRLNTSHLTIPQLQAWLNRLAPFLSSLEARPSLILDLQGSKWRLGQFTPIELEVGQGIELIYASTTDLPNVLPVPHLDFFNAAPHSSQELVLNDAKIHLRVETVRQGTIKARIVGGGLITPNKGITFSASQFRQEALSEKDRAVIELTQPLDFGRYAISYIKDAEEMIKYRALLGTSAYLIAKLEREKAIEEAMQIAEHSNELWLCRGDLGAELGIQPMAEKVHGFSAKVKDFQVPVLMAGQVLEHMTNEPAPTRSEVCYIYDALADGYRGFVLSDETAVGRYPVEACRTAALFED